MKLTAEMLRKKGACDEQVELFVELFGESANVTQKLAMTHATKFDWDWAAKKLLSRAKYTEYYKVCGAAWAEYRKVRGPALAEYCKVCGPAWAEYRKARDAAWAEFDKVCDAARAEYDNVRGPAWARAYNGGGDVG